MRLGAAALVLDDDGGRARPYCLTMMGRCEVTSARMLSTASCTAGKHATIMLSMRVWGPCSQCLHALALSCLSEAPSVVADTRGLTHRRVRRALTYLANVTDVARHDHLHLARCPPAALHLFSQSRGRHQLALGGWVGGVGSVA